MSDVEAYIDDYAAEVAYAEYARRFLELDRWIGADPLLMLADAAGTTTGLEYATRVKPSVKAFRDQFLATGQVSSFEELAGLDQEDPDLEEIFGARRQRRVLIDGANMLASIDGDFDLARLQRWAQDAEPDAYSEDPFGQISGVGLRTFQYLRMVAGIDTVKPDIQVRRFIEALTEASDTPHLDASSDAAVLESCRWLAKETDYRMIELDQIAWRSFADTGGRHTTEADGA